MWRTERPGHATRYEIAVRPLWLRGQIPVEIEKIDPSGLWSRWRGMRLKASDMYDSGTGFVPTVAACDRGDMDAVPTRD